MKDYASFIAGKFVELSADRYRFLIGILSRFEDDGSPFALLRSIAGARAGGRSGELPQPNQPVVDYFFLADTTSGTFKISGRNPPERERDILFELVSGINTKCSPNQLLPIGHLASLQSVEGKSLADSFPWSGLVETDGRGAVLRIYGLRLDLRGSIDRFFDPVITDPDDCHCTTGLLPASLAGIKDVRRAASFILRDAERKVLYSTQPQYNGAGVVQELSPDLPFAGWSIEVAINPAVVQPFLPYAGRGTPWFVLALVGCLILGSGALAFAALRGESQLFRLRQDFISNVSHELRTPLTRVRLFNELLMAGGQSDSEKRRHYRKVIDRECRRLTILIDNILDFSRLERGARKYGKTALDLRATLEDALESFRTASDEGRFKLDSFLEPVGLVMGDSQALQQILINLLDNAVKYSPEGSLIEVRLTSEDNTAKLSVTDHGCGIPENEQERIFEPFYRIGAGKANGATGSGLGLVLVRRSAQAHGGQVSVKSESGTGSTFTITIPLLKGEDSTA